MNHRIAIIGGLGHVGLPLGLVLAERGYSALAIDFAGPVHRIRSTRRLHFVEDGGQELLDAQFGLNWDCTDQYEAASECAHIIVTIGTPVDEHQNPRLEPVINCIRDLLPYLRDGQHIMLRSTVFPGTTRKVDQFLRDNGKKIDVSFCPERIVQGHAISELRELPHIVSGCSESAVSRAKAIFQKLSGSDLNEACVVVSPEEAELTKLMQNAWRYIQFAVANSFYAIADQYGCDYSQIRKAMTFRYPRGQSLPGPGFAAGPCLVKDTVQLMAASPEGFQLGVAARQANEGLPALMVRGLGNVAGKRVAILGMAFKGGNDDTRDSLSFKLKKLLEFAGATVLCSDEYAQREGWVTKEVAVSSCDIAIVAVNHSQYAGFQIPANVQVLDMWGIAVRPAA